MMDSCFPTFLSGIWYVIHEAAVFYLPAIAGQSYPRFSAIRHIYPAASQTQKLQAADAAVSDLPLTETQNSTSATELVPKLSS